MGGKQWGNENRRYAVDGILYYDGALGDTVSIEKAFGWGCDKVSLILTKPRNILRTSDQDMKFAKRIQKEYPVAAKRLRQRAERYNRGVELAKEYESQGRVLIIAPDDICGVDTLTKDRDALKRFYEKGNQDTKEISAFLNNH